MSIPPISPVLNFQSGGPFTVAWAEFLSRAGTAQNYQMGYGDGVRAVMTFDINWVDVNTFIPELLGYSYKTSTGTLSRVLPAAHPIFTWLYASKITNMVPVKVTGKNAYPQQMPTATYDRFRLTVLFEGRPYPVLSDNQLSQYYSPALEVYRYATVDYDFGLDSVSREVGNFTWTEGPNSGSDFTGFVSQLLPKDTFVITWHEVPQLYLFNSAGLPSNLQAAMGRVNLNSFLGLPAQTVLLGPVKITPVPAPVSPVTLGLPSYLPPRLFNVQLPFKHFDPTPHGTARGWNTAPHPTGVFYGIQAKGSTNLPYATYDFTGSAGIFAAAQ